MDALILAAGFGSRLQPVAACKPLALLHGLSLIEIGIRQLASAGATRIVVATGFEAAVVEAALPAIAARAGIPVEARRVADHRQPNGYSVMAGSDGFEGEFLLVMADHILSLDVLDTLIERGTCGNGALLAVDRRISSPLIDPDDATWVKTGVDGRIERIGKALERYDAVDCGAFLATPALPRAIRAAISDGLPGSLSDGMQRLAADGLAATADIGDAWWIDVDDAHALELARRDVREHLPHIFRPAVREAAL